MSAPSSTGTRAAGCSTSSPPPWPGRAPGRRSSGGARPHRGGPCRRRRGTRWIWLLQTGTVPAPDALRDSWTPSPRSPRRPRYCWPARCSTSRDSCTPMPRPGTRCSRSSTRSTLPSAASSSCGRPRPDQYWWPPRPLPASGSRDPICRRAWTWSSGQRACSGTGRTRAISCPPAWPCGGRRRRHVDGATGSGGRASWAAAAGRQLSDCGRRSCSARPSPARSGTAGSGARGSRGGQGCAGVGTPDLSPSRSPRRITAIALRAKRLKRRYATMVTARPNASEGFSRRLQAGPRSMYSVLRT